MSQISIPETEPKKPFHTVFDVIPSMSELVYKNDIARGVPEAEAAKNRNFFKQFDMTTEKLMRECGVSEC